jgi:hypothetical protein
VEATEHIDLWHRDSGSTAGGVIMTGREGRYATLSLEAPDLQLALGASGRDFFDALQQLRLQLEPLGWYPLCNGARIDCYPSGMARDMGEGRAVYVLSQTLDKLPLVPTFEPADREKVGTVVEQDANFERWFAWRTQRSR